MPWYAVSGGTAPSVAEIQRLDSLVAENLLKPFRDKREHGGSRYFIILQRHMQNY